MKFFSCTAQVRFVLFQSAPHSAMGLKAKLLLKMIASGIWVLTVVDSPFKAPGAIPLEANKASCLLCGSARRPLGGMLRTDSGIYSERSGQECCTAAQRCCKVSSLFLNFSYFPQQWQCVVNCFLVHVLQTITEWHVPLGISKLPVGRWNCVHVQDSVKIRQTGNVKI